MPIPNVGLQYYCCSILARYWVLVKEDGFENFTGVIGHYFMSLFLVFGVWMDRSMCHGKNIQKNRDIGEWNEEMHLRLPSDCRIPWKLFEIHQRNCRGNILSWEKRQQIRPSDCKIPCKVQEICKRNWKENFYHGKKQATNE